MNKGDRYIFKLTQKIASVIYFFVKNQKLRCIVCFSCSYLSSKQTLVNV